MVMRSSMTITILEFLAAVFAVFFYSDTWPPEKCQDQVVAYKRFYLQWMDCLQEHILDMSSFMRGSPREINSWVHDKHKA